VKTKLRAGLIQQLDSNTGLASQLTSYHIAYGNWRVMFTGLEDINRVTAEDVQRVLGDPRQGVGLGAVDSSALSK